MAAPTRDMVAIRAHYELEKELAARLREAPREERGRVYAEVYDELFRRIPDHPGNLQKRSSEMMAVAADQQLRFLDRFLRPDGVYLEIGAGDCALANAVAQRAAKVYAIEVSAEMTGGQALAENLELVITDGLAIPVPAGAVDVAYSNQVMEHLHPDDALDQLRNIAQSLAPSGVYLCITPNRLNGPHDISADFDTEATGFHLKEYTTTELATLFRQVGFRRVGVMVSLRVRILVLPAAVIRPLEALLSLLPYRLRNAITRRQPVKQFLGIRIVGFR